MKSALRQAQRAFDKLMVQKDHRTPHKKKHLVPELVEGQVLL